MWFENCETIEECREEYKKLAKQLHPDIGGNKEDFQRLGEEYEKKLRELQEEHPYISEAYVNLAQSLLEIAKTKYPNSFKKASTVAEVTPLLLGMFGETLSKNKKVKTACEFLGKLNF